jgi:hydroxyethylthiazole kinase-like uncharacterized protein yjeF
MLPVLDNDGIREADSHTIKDLGVPGIVLMENAATGVVDAVREVFPEARKILILCGPGNNGGDGLAAARHLLNGGQEIQVCLLGDQTKLSPDAATNFDLAKAFEVPVTIIEGDDLNALDGLLDDWDPDLVIDALLGTGIDRPLGGRFADAVDKVASTDLPVAAVDVPTGLNGSSSEIPGTHGFGLWNDPFSFSLGFGSGNLLPALPNAAWFFFASPPNYLSFRDDLPANGALAATFRSPPIPTWLASTGLIGIPLLMIPPVARLARKIASRVIRQDAAQLNHDPTEWHSYRLEWQVDNVSFYLDENIVLSTEISPQGPLGFVLWIDNQYAAWTPEGRMKYGTLPSPSGWLEVKDLTIQPDAPE